MHSISQIKRWEKLGFHWFETLHLHQIYFSCERIMMVLCGIISTLRKQLSDSITLFWEFRSKRNWISRTRHFVCCPSQRYNPHKLTDRGLRNLYERRKGRIFFWVNKTHWRRKKLGIETMHEEHVWESRECEVCKQLMGGFHQQTKSFKSKHIFLKVNMKKSITNIQLTKWLAV